VLANRVRWPGPRSRHPLTRLLRGLWTLPTNLVGHAAGLLVSGRRPRLVAGRAARGWLYPIRSGIGLDWVGAVTIGHAILYRPGMLDRPGDLRARLTLAHELAHTRQHDCLGPLYLPLHILAQLASAALSLLGPRPTVSRVHDHNPLEQTFICLSAGAPHLPFPRELDVEAYLRELGA
jgi:hypothetical protein